MPFILLAIFVILLQVALTAVVFLILRQRQDLAFRIARRRAVRHETKTTTSLEAKQFAIDKHEVDTKAVIDEISKTADKALHLANDMSRRFDGGEKPKPSVNSMSIEARREARENNFVRKRHENNSRETAQ